MLRGTRATALYYLGSYEEALAEARRAADDAAVSADHSAEVATRMALGQMLLSMGDSVAGPERCAVGGERTAGADVRDDADVLVALDDRERRRAGVVRACVLLRLAAEGVLVRPADPGGEHPQEDGARLDPLGIRIATELQLTRSDERRRENVVHSPACSRSQARFRRCASADSEIGSSSRRIRSCSTQIQPA